MDFLDPQKERLNRIVLFISYGLVGLAITIASIVLLYQTDGYCVDGKGAVDRCGLVFVSSQPSGAELNVDGKVRKERTNTKLNLRGGTYEFRLSKTGYRDWSRKVTVLGGDVQRFDYPVLFPGSLQTTAVATLSSPIAFTTQSPDRKWAIVAEAGTVPSLHFYNLETSGQPDLVDYVLPTGLTSPGDGEQKWQVIEWAENNRHLLVKHMYTSAGVVGEEYLLFDRQNAADSRNLTRDLTLIAGDQLTLFDKQPDSFYVYNSANRTLRTQSLEGDVPSTLSLSSIVSFKQYGDDTLLYATTAPPSGKQTSDKLSIVLQQANQIRILRELPVSAGAYLLDIARYDGDWYIAIGADSEKGVHIYRNPLQQRLSSAASLPSPVRFLKVDKPNYVAFSANAQYILAQNNQQIATYDVENSQAYIYKIATIDQPQTSVRWMDGHRLMYVSGGHLMVFDYDNINAQTLQSAAAEWPVFFTPNYREMYNLQAVEGSTSHRFVRTPLVIE